MEMSYKQLERILISHFKIHPDREPTFRSRIKQLQRLNFPAGVNVGRGLKMAYTTEHLLKLVMAFELIGFHVPAQAATDIIIKDWSAISAAFGLSALLLRRPDNDEEQKSNQKVLLSFDMHSMFEIQHRRTWRAPEQSTATIWDLSAAQQRLGLRNGSIASLYIRVSDLLQKLSAIARTDAGVSLSVFDDEFLLWLPKETEVSVYMHQPYPDRSNLDMRKYLHSVFGNDPTANTPEGILEADQFREWVLTPLPF